MKRRIFTQQHRKRISEARKKQRTMRKLPLADLELYRKDPTRPTKSDRVVCRECAQELIKIIKGHLAPHGLTGKEYDKKWNNPPRYAADWLRRHNKSCWRWRKAHPRKAKAISNKWYAAHGREHGLAYKKAHRDEINAALRERYRKDVKFAKKMRKKKNAWAKAHPEQGRDRNRGRWAEILAFRALGASGRLPTDGGATREVQPNSRESIPKGPAGRPKQTEENRQYFKVGEMIEQKLASGMELTAARRSVASAMRISYSSVVRYHKQFRGRLTRDGNRDVISITG